jgi:hypothetical protein
MSHPPLDPISVGIAVATLVVGAGSAQYAGPYLVIFIGALLGSMIALRRRDPGPRMHAALFVVILIVWSMSLTVPIAEGTAAAAGKDWKWLAFPVATGLAALGEDWERVGAKVKSLYFAALDRMRGAS